MQVPRFVILLAVLLLFVAGCAESLIVVQQTTPVRTGVRWALLPVANFTETAQAGERVEGLLDSELREAGVVNLEHYPPLKDDDAHLTTSEHQRVEESLAWARSAKFDYAVTGSVVEWRYKGTIDAEPAVGVTVSVIELPSGRTVFSGSGARTGTSTDSVSATALTILHSVVAKFDKRP